MLCKEPKRRSSDVWDPTDTLPGLPADEIAAPETSKKKYNEKKQRKYVKRNTKTQSLHMSRMCYITKISPVKLVRLMTLKKKGQQSMLSVATNTLFSSSRKHWKKS